MSFLGHLRYCEMGFGFGYYKMAICYYWISPRTEMEMQESLTMNRLFFQMKSYLLNLDLDIFSFFCLFVESSPFYPCPCSFQVPHTTYILSWLSRLCIGFLHRLSPNLIKTSYHTIHIQLPPSPSPSPSLLNIHPSIQPPSLSLLGQIHIIPDPNAFTTNISSIQ